MFSIVASAISFGSYVRAEPHNAGKFSGAFGYITRKEFTVDPIVSLSLEVMVRYSPRISPIILGQQASSYNDVNKIMSLEYAFGGLERREHQETIAQYGILTFEQIHKYLQEYPLVLFFANELSFTCIPIEGEIPKNGVFDYEWEVRNIVRNPRVHITCGWDLKANGGSNKDEELRIQMKTYN